MTPSDASSPASRDEIVDGAAARSRADRPVPDAVAGPGEERHHEVVEVEPRLAHEGPEGVGAAQPAQACRGKELTSTRYAGGGAWGTPPPVSGICNAPVIRT